MASVAELALRLKALESIELEDEGSHNPHNAAPYPFWEVADVVKAMLRFRGKGHIDVIT